MAKLDVLVKAWDEANWEFSLAFEGLSDTDLWLRPHPSLLSIGELAGHVAYWEAVRMTGATDKPDLATLPIQSPLVNGAFSYYTSQLGNPVSLNLAVDEVVKELARIYEESKAALLKVNPDYDDLVPGHGDATWGFYVQYLLFHVAYHTGQAYSARHLLGHTTTDN